MVSSKSLFLKLITIYLALILSGCATGFPVAKGDKFITKEDQSLPLPHSDTAIIVFLSSVFISDAIYDITKNEPKVVGVISTGKKTTYEVPAGKHYFTTLSSGGFLVADLSGGKTYYVLVQQSTAAAAAGLAISTFVSIAAGSSPGPGILIPVRNGEEGPYQYSSKYIQDRIKDDELIAISQKATDYYSQEFWKESARAKRDKYLSELGRHSEYDLSQFTLNSVDGVRDQSLRKENTEQSSSISGSFDEDLEALKALRDDGIFSEEEYLKQKNKLIDEQSQ